MGLRNYQIEAIEKIRTAYSKGYKAPCLVAPCGAGKSIIVSEMAKRTTEKKNRVLFIVHRKELCEQIENTLRSWGVDMDLCTVAMVQTISRRIEKIEEPKLIIVDENHHALTSSYKKIFEKFKDVHRIGVTATPQRLSGEGLIAVNDVLIETVTCKWLIENKFLAPFKYFAPPVANIQGLKIKNGEFEVGDCEKKLNIPAICGDVIKYYKEKADGKKAICYCVSVTHSKAMVDTFNRHGIVAAHIDGTTPKDSRSEIVDKFRTGEIRILCNMDIISEGFDVPDCEVSILLRPTMSLTLYIQQSMRSMRYMEGKTAIILDHVGNAFRFGLPNEDRVWSLGGIKKKEKKKPEPKIMECDACHHIWSISPRMENESILDHRLRNIKECPECGHVPDTEKARAIAIKENEELIEFTELQYRKSRMQKRIEFKAIAEERGYKKGWVYYQMKKLDSKHKEEVEGMRID